MSGIYVDTLTHSPRGLKLILDSLGDERVVLGSDYPLAWARAIRSALWARWRSGRARSAGCGATMRALSSASPDGFQ